MLEPMNKKNQSDQAAHLCIMSRISEVYGPQREKTCLWDLQTIKVQTSLHICRV